MVNDFAAKVVHKLGFTFNSFGETCWNGITTLCSRDCSMSKQVIRESSPVQCFSDFSSMEKYFALRCEIERGMPDLVMKIDTFRDYSTKSGLQIKCEYSYKGTFLKESSPISSSSSSAENSDSSSSSLSTVTRVPIRCNGTIFIYLNQDNQISNLEIIARYL
jgi:hypothetical protein